MVWFFVSRIMWYVTVLWFLDEDVLLIFGVVAPIFVKLYTNIQENIIWMN